MDEQTMVYAPGTRVWCKAMNWIWWPGQIVSLEDTPEEYQMYVAKKKNCIAVVYFKTEEYHETVVSMKKIKLYDCSEKLQLLEKGYELYEKQLKGGAIKNNIKMENFLTEAKMAERDIGGDENIFDQFAKKNEIVHPKINIKELFVSSKDKKKNRSSLTPNKVQNKISPNSKHSVKSLSLSGQKIQKTRAPIPGLLHCHGVCGVEGCTYSSKRNTDFQMHKKSRVYRNKVKNNDVSFEDEQSELEGQASCSKSIIRKQSLTSRNRNENTITDPEKIKSQAEKLTDWKDSDGGCQDKSIRMKRRMKRSKTIKAISSETSSFIKSTSSTVNDFDDDNASIENHASSSQKIRINSAMPKLKNKNTQIVNEKQINGDENLILSDLKSNERKESGENIKNQQCTDDSTTADMSTDGDKVDSTIFGNSTIFKRDLSSIPDWIKTEKWDTLKDSHFNEAMNVWKTGAGKLLDLSKSRIVDALQPVWPNWSETATLNRDIELEFEPDEPGYETRIIIIPIDNSVKPLSDEELKKQPFIQKVLKKIEAGDTDDIFVEFPGATLLPK